MGLIDSIKRDANKNRTKVQSSEASDLEKILNKLFYLSKNIEEETKFIKQVMTRGFETQERVGLHASAMLVGDKEFCVRQQVLSLIYKQAQGDDVNIGLKRIFAAGDSIHEKWQRLFIRAGFAKADDCDVTQYDEEYKMSYTPDIICQIPEFYDGKMVVEIKSVNTYQFKNMVKHPSAWKQCQWYMHKTGIKKGIVLCEDKNTQEFKLEVYDYDAHLIIPYSERAEQVMYAYDAVYSEHKMVSRTAEAKSSTCKRCDECPMKDACWNVGMGRVKLETDNWD